jgi:hypothetical protein
MKEIITTLLGIIGILTICIIAVLTIKFMFIVAVKMWIKLEDYLYK